MSSDIEVTDMTGDGRWLIVCGYEANLYVYYNNNGFALNQTIQETSGYIWAAAISDDHQWLVFGDSLGKVFVLKYNGAQFILNQTITPGSGSIYSIAITNDGNRMAISPQGNYLHYYVHDGQKYERSLTFTFPNTGSRRVHMTDDNQYITIADRYNQYVVVYKAKEDSF